MANPIAGWYDDGSGQMRWWDGKAWTAHTAVDSPVGSPMGSEQAESSTVTTQAPPEVAQRHAWPWLLGGGILLFLILAAAGIVMTFILMGGINGQASPADTVKQFDKAWQTSDCALVQSVTTTSYQKDLGFDDCATFRTAAKSLADSTDNYTVTVSSVKIQNNEASVQTVESYFDIKNGQDGSTSYIYDLVNEGGKWVISGVSSTG
jgi:hypothetical protein